MDKTTRKPLAAPVLRPTPARGPPARPPGGTIPAARSPGNLPAAVTAMIYGSRLRMNEHVHVRIHDGVAVSDAGELVETLRCGCGAAWTAVHRVEEGEPER